MAPSGGSGYTWLPFPFDVSTTEQNSALVFNNLPLLIPLALGSALFAIASAALTFRMHHLFKDAWAAGKKGARFVNRGGKGGEETFRYQCTSMQRS